MPVRYTPELLDEVLKRDNAVLVSYNGILSKRIRITFICHCGKESSKLGYDLIKRIGAYCKECALQRGIDKTKHTLKERYDKVPICTVESLYITVERDGALLIQEYNTITQNSIVPFICNCGKESEKNCLQLIKVSGAFCEKCTRTNWTQNTKETNMERYGVTCSVHDPAIQQKSKETIMKHYGVEHVFQSEEVRQQINKTILEKYGVTHIMHHEGIKQKQKDNNMERYGVEYSTQREEVKDKMKATNLQRYGVEHYSQTAEMKEKIIKTTLKRHGVEHYSKTDAYKEKILKTNMERYGVSNSNKTKETRDKIKATCIERYGVEHPSQYQEIMEKAQKNAKKYKEYKMPSGTIRKVQGYEPFALNGLVKIYQEDDIITDRKEIPRITYIINDKKKYYFPDIFIKSINTIIEVKSTWTYNSKIDNIHEKENATKMAGYNYEIWIFDRKGNKIETDKTEKEFDNHG
jgi:hypothetical protein